MKYPISRKSVCSLLIAGLWMLPTFHPSTAQEDLGTLQDLLPPSSSVNSARRSLNGQVRLFDNVLIHPMPVWSSFANGPAPAERSKIKTANKNGLYQMSMVPREEDFANWQNLFTVTAHQRDKRSVGQQGRQVMQQFRTICSPSNLQVFKVHASPTMLIQVVACGNFSRERSKGQMAAIVTLRNESGLVTLTRQWSTPAFQSKIATSWPVPKNEMDGVLGELSRSKLVPLKKNQG